MDYKRFDFTTAVALGNGDMAMFCRDRETDEKARVDPQGQRPYIYVREREREKAEKKEEVVEVDDAKGAESLDDGEDVVKVFLREPNDAPRIRDDFSTTWESDVPYTQRVRIDMDVKNTFKVPEFALKEIGDNHYEAPWSMIEPDEEVEAETDKRNFYFDIEVGGERHVEPYEDDLEPVTAITAYDSYEEQLYTWTFRNDWDRETENRGLDVSKEGQYIGRDVGAGVQSEANPGKFFPENNYEKVPWEIRRFGSKLKMGKNFMDHLRETGYDVVSGWYSDGFDVPYLINWFDQIGLDPGEMSPVGQVDDGEGDYSQPKIAGFFMNDLERRMDQIEDSGPLEDVAREQVGLVWEQESANIQELWENDPNRMLVYNALDVVATAAVDDYVGITDFYIEKMYATGVRGEELERASKVIDYYHFFEADTDEKLPRRDSSESADFGGAIVFNPDVSGVFGPVMVPDLSKVYPSIMLSLNLSYENYIGRDLIHLHENVVVQGIEQTFELEAGEVVDPAELGKEARKNLWEELYELNSNGSLEKATDWEFEVDDELEGEGQRIPNGVRIRQGEGLTNRVLKKMFNLRERYERRIEEISPVVDNFHQKKDRLLRKRQVEKDNINAVYGVMGFAGFRLFRPEIAETVTFVGRHLLKTCRRAVDYDTEHRVIYGDSVTGDTTVPINGKSVEIGDLYDDLSETCPTKGEEKDILDTRGMDLTTPSVDENGTVTTDTVDSIIRHRVNKDIYRVKTESGKSVKVTEDHSLLVWDDGQLVEKTPKEISDTDSIFLPTYGRMQDLWGGRRGNQSSSPPYARHNNGRIQGTVPQCPPVVGGVQREQEGTYGVRVGIYGGPVVGRGVPKEDERGWKCSSWRECGSWVERGNDGRRDEGTHGRRTVSGMAKETKGGATGILQATSRRKRETEYQIYEGRKKVNERIGSAISENSQKCRWSGLQNRTGTSSARWGLPSGLSSKGCVPVCRRLLVALLSKTSPRTGNGSTGTQLGTGQDSQQEDDEEWVPLREDMGTYNTGQSGTYQENSQNNTAEKDRVTSIEKIDTEEEYVYDIDVSENDTFLANGIFVHNTDSIFIRSSNIQDNETAVEEGKRITDHINNRMDDFAQNFLGIGSGDHRFKIDFEKVYERMFIGDSKKRYAGKKVWDEKDGWLGDESYIDITGFEYVRGDSAPITGEFQKDLFSTILDEGGDKDEVLDVVEEYYEGVKNADYDPMKCVRKPSLGGWDKQGGHSKAARYTDQFFETDGDVAIHEGDNIAVFELKDGRAGYDHTGDRLPSTDKIGLVEGMDPPLAKCECWDCDHEWEQKNFVQKVETCPACGSDDISVDGCRVDWDSLADKWIKSKARKVLKHLGWENELGSLGDQNTMEQFV